MKKVCAAIFFFAVAALLFSSATVYSSDMSSFYQSARRIMMNNPSWTEEEFIAEIQDICDKNEIQSTNWDKKILNPYIYKHYNLTVYGLPEGKFFNTGSGHMCRDGNISEQGEYQLLGYAEEGFEITNDLWHNQNFTGTGKFETYHEVTYRDVSGAVGSWDKLSPSVKDYLIGALFYDDDYIDPGQTPYNLDHVFYGNTDAIYSKALVQIPPGVKRQGSVRLEYYKGEGYDWNTLIYQPTYTFEPECHINCDTTFTMSAYENEITITPTVTADLQPPGSDCTMDNLERVSFELQGQKGQSRSINGSNTTYTSSPYQLTFSRGELSTGANKRELFGAITVKTIYDEYIDAIAHKKITINVEETRDPYATCVLTTNPTNVQYSDADVIVDVTIRAELHNWIDLNQIDNWRLEVRMADEESVQEIVLPPALAVEHTFRFTVTKEKLDSIFEDTTGFDQLFRGIAEVR